MSNNLTNYNGRFCESDFENAFISFLEESGWTYTPGAEIVRENGHEVVCISDLRSFLSKTNPDLNDAEVKQICDTVRLVGSESHFATLHKVYGWMVDGIQRSKVIDRLQVRGDRLEVIG